MTGLFCDVSPETIGESDADGKVVTEGGDASIAREGSNEPLGFAPTFGRALKFITCVEGELELKSSCVAEG